LTPPPEIPGRAAPPPAIRPIRAGALRLEPQTAAHAREMFAVLSDPAIYAYENAPPPSRRWLRARFARLEARRSPDGRELWLNWVIRLPSRGLIGYVQATVGPDGSAGLAYVLASAHWGRGFARQATRALIAELAKRYRVRRVTAVLKRRNARSVRLLERLGFAPATPALRRRHALERDERLMVRELRTR